VRVDDIVESALARAKASRGGQRDWRHEVTEGPVQVVVDRHRIDQAVDELVDNAVKYSPAGSAITIGAELTAANRTESNGSAASGAHLLRVRVTDAGEGLDTARLAELSGGFTQGDGSATRRVGGLGLGLALADRIARAHGGALTCRSSVGSGATFTLVIPIQGIAAVESGASTNGRSHS
jgi:signal transduction histidine kinase